MEIQTARQIIDTLMQGVHPITGECMPPESPYNEPQVIRALIVVSRALDECAVAAPNLSCRPCRAGGTP